MPPVWDDVIARVRGLNTHLLSPRDLEELAALNSHSAVARRLAQSGYPSADAAPVSADSLETSVRRTAAARMDLVARWCRGRVSLLRVIFEDEDRRSLRQIVRGIVEGAPPDHRLGGVIPTPALPERALRELARSESVAALGALLAAWGHPMAPLILAAGAARRPALLPLEVSLARRFAERALAAARRDHHLRRFVSETIDLENIWSCTILAGGSPDLRVEDCVVPGGTCITPVVMHRAVEQADAAGALEVLAKTLGDCRVAEALRRGAAEPWELERLVLAARRRDQREHMLLAPLSSAPILVYLLGLRLEVYALQQLIWGLALGAPAAGRFYHEVLA